VQRARGDNANLHAAVQWHIAGARAGDTEALEKGLLMAGHLNWFWHIGGQHLTARVAVDTLLTLAAGRAPSLGRSLSQLTDTMISTVTGEWDRCIRSSLGAYHDGLAIGDEVAASEAKMFAGYGHLHLGQMGEAGAALDEAIARARPVSEFNLSLAMAIKGVHHFATGDVDAGITLVEESLVMTERRGDYEQRGVAMSLLAQMIFAKGDHARALAVYRQSLASLEAVGDRPEIARVLCEMGWTALAAADVAEAQRRFQLAVREYEAVGSAKGTGLALMGLAAVEAAAGRTERAVAIAAAAEALSKRAGIVVDHTMDPGVGGRIEALKASIPTRTLDGLVANASELTPADVLAMVGEPHSSLV
jgi:tetratricopeptide (TPR) repeat protein